MLLACLSFVLVFFLFLEIKGRNTLGDPRIPANPRPVHLLPTLNRPARLQGVFWGEGGVRGQKKAIPAPPSPAPCSVLPTTTPNYSSEVACATMSRFGGGRITLGSICGWPITGHCKWGFWFSLFFF